MTTVTVRMFILQINDKKFKSLGLRFDILLSIKIFTTSTKTNVRPLITLTTEVFISRVLPGKEAIVSTTPKNVKS